MRRSYRISKRSIHFSLSGCGCGTRYSATSSISTKTIASYASPGRGVNEGAGREEMGPPGFFLYGRTSSYPTITTRSLKRDFSARARFSQSQSTEDSSPSPLSKKLTLKQFVRPFLMKFHPDRQGIEAVNSAAARDVNLKALQILNGMIDTIDQIYTRAAEPSKARRGGARAELQSTYVIEFLIQSGNDDGKRAVKRPKDQPVATRRSVELFFSKEDCRNVQTVDARTGKYSLSAAKALRLKTFSELAKLLRVAKIPLSTEYSSMMKEFSSEIESNRYEKELFNELDLGQPSQGGFAGRDFQYTGKPKTEFQKSKEKYMASIDWDKHNKLYRKLLKDAEKDLATDGLMTMSVERQQRFVADVISKIRVFDKSLDGTSDEESDESNSNEESSVSSIDTLQQLIAVRRLSLLFTDHFEELYMEEYGAVWERLVIVFTSGKSEAARKTGLPFSRIKRLRVGRESGFKFLFHADDRLTVFVPIEFDDDELIRELKWHLEDFHAIQIAKDGIMDYFPSYYDDLKGHPTII